LGKNATNVPTSFRNITLQSTYTQAAHRKECAILLEGFVFTRSSKKKSAVSIQVSSMSKKHVPIHLRIQRDFLSSFSDIFLFHQFSIRLRNGRVSPPHKIGFLCIIVCVSWSWGRSSRGSTARPPRLKRQKKVSIRIANTVITFSRINMDAIYALSMARANDHFPLTIVAFSGIIVINKKKAGM